jgi:MFS family permease
MVGKMIGVLGRRNLIVFGMCLMGSSFLIFGLISDLEQKEAFITLALLNRFLQGFASSLIQTTMYSISTNFFPDHKDAMVGYIEAVTGVGLILGPLIGSGLYSIGGYKFIFFSFGSLFIVFSAFIKGIFDDSIDKKFGSSTNSSPAPTTSNRLASNENGFVRQLNMSADNLIPEHDDDFAQVNEIENSSNESMEDDGEKISIGTFELLMYPKFLFAALSGTLGYFLYGFMEPVLAFRVSSFNLTQVQIGLFFIVMPIFYIPTSVLV